MTTYREPAPIAVDPPPPRVVKRRVVKRFPWGIYTSLPITMLVNAFTQPVLMFVDGQVVHGYIAVVMFLLALVVFTLGMYEESEVVEVVDE